MPFQIFDPFDVLGADELIGRRITRTRGNLQIAVGPFVPDDDVVGVDVGEMQLAGDQRLELNIASADADQIDRNAFLGVKTFL